MQAKVDYHIIGYTVLHLVQKIDGLRPLFGQVVQCALRYGIHYTCGNDGFAWEIHRNTGDKEADSGQNQTHYRPYALRTDTIYNFYALNTGRNDRRVGDQSDVVSEAGSSCDSAGGQKQTSCFGAVRVNDVNQPEEDRRACGEGSPGCAGSHGKYSGNQQTNDCCCPGCDTQ